MNATMACIAGEEIFRQWESGKFAGRRIGRRSTPFGDSGEIFLVEDECPFYLLPRYGEGLAKTPADRINARANLYALKDLGVGQVLAWGPGGAVTHDLSVGEIVVLDDVIDRTYLRAKTFFENSPLGILRQFPVFCPGLRRLADEALSLMKLPHHPSAVAAVFEGPRLETPAEVRMLASVGAQVVTHNFVPEVFLAKELELCYVAVCYVVNYAETGSKHRPFAAGELFGGLTQRNERERLTAAIGSMNAFVRAMAAAVAAAPRGCECDKTMEHNRRTYNLRDDWHTWFGKGPA